MRTRWYFTRVELEADTIRFWLAGHRVWLAKDYHSPCAMFVAVAIRENLEGDELDRFAVSCGLFFAQ